MTRAMLLGALLLAACGRAEACDPDLSAHEQQSECDDGNPRTLDKCGPDGACEHMTSECDPLDPPDTIAVVCGGDPCLAWRCLYGPTGAGRCVPLGPVGHCP